MLHYARALIMITTTNMNAKVVLLFTTTPMISLASVDTISFRLLQDNIFSIRQYPRFGLCLNRDKILNPSSGPFDTPAFHCHFDSSFCEPDEEWLNPFEAEDEGLGPCTCDDDFNSNVLIHTCYEDSLISCSTTADQVSGS